MYFRDFIRFALISIAIILLDKIFYSIWKWPIHSDAEVSIIAIGLTIIIAIREKKE